MKKLRFLVMAAAGCVGVQQHVKAALPQEPMLIVGNKAYYYSNIASQIDQINNQIFNNPTEIYYSNGSSILNVVTNSVVSETQLSSLIGSNIYYYKNGTTITYVYGNSSGYNPVASSSYATVQVSLTKIIDNSLYLLNTKIINISGITGSSYYSVANTKLVALKSINDTIATSVTSSSGSVTLYLFSDSDTTNFIATGSLTLPSTTDGSVSTINVPLTSYATTTPTSSSSSLGQGNMSNTGLVASDGTYRYYSNTADSGKIYKMSDSGLENYVICDDNAKYVTAVGGWVYYSNYSDGGKIYKVKIDGTKKQKISDNIGTFLNVVGDKVYYSNKSDGGKLYCLDASGNSTPLCSDEADYVSISGGNTIFYSNASDGGRLYSISLDGSNRLLRSSSIYNVRYINTSDSSNVYYSTADGKVYKLDGSSISIKLVTTDKNGNSSVPEDEEATHINVSDSNIYYVSLLDGNKIYKVGTNGGVGEKITDVAASDINIYVQNPDNASTRKDIIYFTQNGKLYQVLDPVATVDKNGNTTYKLQTAAVTKPKSTVTIKTVNNIAVAVDDTDVGKGIGDIDLDKYLPDKVPATMSDNTIKQLVVNWNRSNYTNKNGVCIFNGTIVGYGKTITLSLSLASTGIGSQYVQVTNNIGKNDTLVTLDGANLSAGDTLKVYDSLTATKPIVQQKADSSGKISIAGMDLNKNGGILYVSVTRGTQAESRRTAVSYGVESPAAPIGVSIDLSGVTTSGPADSTNDIDITNLLVNSSTDSVVVGNLQYRVAPISTTGKVATVGESDWKDVPSTGVISNTISIGKGGTQIQFRIKASGNTPASSPTTAIVISPRAAAPSGLSFDDTAITNDTANNKVTITGTTASMQYYTSASGWQTCSLGSTIISSVPKTEPVKVRRKATTSTLPSVEAVEIKITSDSGLYSISGINGTLNLTASTPVTWSVSDEDSPNGIATTKATINSNATTPTKAVISGLENGRVKVWATAKDGTGLQGYVIITIGAQKSITVANDTQLAAAFADSTVTDIKLLSRVYLMDNYTLPSNRDLTIEGIGNMSQIKINSLNNGSFITASGSSLTLKNLTIDGNTKNISNVINASQNLTLDGVYFTNIKNDNGQCWGINQTSGTLTVKNSVFDSTNALNRVINFNSASTGVIFNNNFAANSASINGYQNGVYQSNGTLEIIGNKFANYSHYVASSTDTVPTVGRADTGVAVTAGTAKIGGLGLLQPNNFDNCVAPVLKVTGAAVTNDNSTPTTDLLDGNNNVSNPVLFNGILINPGTASSAIASPVIVAATPLQGGTSQPISSIVSGLPTTYRAYVIPTSWNYTAESDIRQYMTSDNCTYFTNADTNIIIPRQTNDYKVVLVDGTTIGSGTVLAQSGGSFIIDSTKPILQSAAVNNGANNQIVLTYDETLNSSVALDATHFGVNIAGSAASGFTAAVSGKTVILTLGSSIPHGISVTVNYTPGATGNIQDIAGNLASSLSSYTVTNSVLGVNPPDLTPATGKSTAEDIDITFTDDSTWRTGITHIMDGTTDIISSCDRTQSGKIVIPAGTFSTAGVHSLTISSPGYNDAVISQNVFAAVSSITSSQSNGNYKAGTVIPITVNFSGNVTVTGIPKLTLNSGGTATYASGSGTSILVFNYTVGAADNTPSSNYLNVSSINLNSGTMKSTAGSVTGDANILILPAYADSTSLASTKNIVIDTTAPAADGTNPITASNDGGTLNTIQAGDTITIKFNDKINTSNITAANLALSSNSFGTTGVIIAPQNSTTYNGTTYSDTFKITLGTGESISGGETITITAVNVVDEAGNSAAAPIIFTIPSASLGF
ncbi:DUF5050 domain-containing protein [Clostridiaceae bacterium UIB06]|uniref:DUF5050 domain-containing protein n=1 Tax=Clostridium thailandense TaxID=2794346 RepID=A0A949WQ34_9CLOT|nr:DUF5050 domain-containing protein [Clostridium thailandense]MBV7272226.1 DUF5050 domain-containing protein [Clostridium thailandense]MCH5136489.1 DUF5050 domain-containing protein [Clostridiaceae bacterium UIB06]